MLPLLDAQVRLVLLNHVAVQLAESEPSALQAAGIDAEQIAGMRQLSVADLNRLAAMRGFDISVALDAAGLKASLRTVARINEARELERYFIRNGASCRMMGELFSVRHKVTLRHRREYGVPRSSGRLRLPDHGTRERIYRAWFALRESDPRLRYYRLHQTYPDHPIAVLEAVVLEFEADR